MVIGDSYRDAAAHPPEEEIGMQALHYHDGYVDSVNLAINPNEEMTWKTWIYALLGIERFMQRREYVELSFDVVVLGLRRVGTGRVFQEDGISFRSYVLARIRRPILFCLCNETLEFPLMCERTRNAELPTQ